MNKEQIFKELDKELDKLDQELLNLCSSLSYFYRRNEIDKNMDYVNRLINAQSRKEEITKFADMLEK